MDCKHGSRWLDHTSVCYACEYEKQERPTLRDKFAMAALTGLLAGGATGMVDYAGCAYRHADAMLAARSK